MGCCCHRDPILNPSIPGRDILAFEVFNEIGLDSSDISTFFKLFNDIDLDGSGELMSDEFYAYFRIEENKISKNLFQLCDLDNSHTLNFCEFTITIWLGIFLFFIACLPSPMQEFFDYATRFISVCHI